MSVIIRCDVGQEIGLGHYFRSSLIKNSFEKNGMKACLALKYLDSDKCTLPCDLLIDSNYEEEINKYNFKNTNFVLDILHRNNHSKKELKNYLINLKDNKNKIVLIEGLENDACPSHYYPYLHALITPYINANNQKKHTKHFLGKNFLVLDQSRILERKEIKKDAHRILITFGGSDPFNQSASTLNILKTVKDSKNLEVTVIVGPLMKKDQVELLKINEHFFRKLDLVHSVQNLKNYFEWTDLAITNTGNTRYELAASGVPFIILPFCDAGYSLSVIFKEFNAAHLESYSKDPLVAFGIDVVSDLLLNYKKRLEMSVNGRTYFNNPNGTDNLVKGLIEVFNETN